MNLEVNYDTLAAQAEGLLSGQKHRIANAANLSALLYMELPDVNWVGFYFLEHDELVLGPFQGQPACVEIPMGQGVCGTAAATRRIQRIADVHARSELVVPLIADGVVLGVLDLDSPSLDRFNAEDEAGLARLADIYLASLA